MRNIDAVSLLISDVIDRVRRERQMSQATLAKRMQTSETCVSHVLDGRTATSRTYARALDALDCELVVTVRHRATAPPPERVQ